MFGFFNKEKNIPNPTFDVVASSEERSERDNFLRFIANWILEILGLWAVIVLTVVVCILIYRVIVLPALYIANLVS